jgi:trk system potassium uptake protein TrkA
MEAGDELLFITTPEQEARLQDLVAPDDRHRINDAG